VALIRPVTSEEQKISNLFYGKDMEDLTIDQRTRLRKRISSGKIDTITFEQYLEDYKGMANDPDYIPKYVKPNVGTGMSPQQLRAKAEAKKTIEGFDSKFNKNISRRKRIKMKAAIEADPERKQREMAKKAERRRGRRVAKLSDKAKLSANERLLNFEQSLITRQLNDKIKANPNLVLNNKKLIDKLSVTVDGDGNIIKSKPTIYELDKRGLFEIEHQRDVRKAGAMKDFPYNRNPILGPYNRSGGFKDMAEKFIEKNPDPNNSKVKKIIEKAKELKITLQPEVPTGTFKTKGIGYKQPASATGKFIEYAKSTLPDLVDDKIGLSGFTGDTKMLETGLGLKRGTVVDSFVEKVKSIPGGCRTIVSKALGGPIGKCEAIIKADPERAALKLNNAITATKGPLKDLKEDSQKLIRLYRGEEPARKTELYKSFKGEPGMYDESLKGRFFFDNPADARYYAQRQGTLTGNVKSVDVPEKMVNIGRKVAERRRGPNLGGEVILPKKFVGKEKINIPQTAMARAGAVVEKLKYDNIKGAFVNVNKGDSVAPQAEIKQYAVDNPMEVKVGEPAKLPKPNKSVLKTVGKTLAAVGAPLPTALLDTYFINEQIKQDKTTSEIVSNPLNWLGLATMSPLSRAAGIDKAGKVNTALRLGLNPGTIRGISRFVGLPGLALSTAMTAYDQYTKYKNQEGFIYKMFNKEES